MSERFDNFKKSLRHIFTPKNILRGSAIVGIVVSELGCDVQPTKDPEKSTKIDYSAQILDGGISDQFKNEIANTNETMIGSFRVNVVDNDPKSSDVKEEFAVIQNPSGAIAVAHNDNDNTPKVLGYIEPIGQNQILLVDPDSLLPVFIFPNDENQKAEFYPFAVGVGVDKLPGYDGSPIEIEMGTPDGLKIHAMLARPHPSLTPTPYSTPTPEPTATEAPLEIPEYIKEIKTVNDPLKWRSAPEIDPKDTPALAQVLMERFNNGEFDDLIPANFHYVPFNFSINGYKYHGNTTALYPLVGNPIELDDVDNRWYFLSSIYNDKASRRTIAHYFVKQIDGSVGQYFATLGMNVEKLTKGNINSLIGYVAGDNDTYTTPADFSELSGCMEMTTGDTVYCDYYMNNRDLILELYKNWAKTGFVPLKISNGEIIIPLQGR